MLNSAKSCLRLYSQGLFCLKCFLALLFNQSLDRCFARYYFSILCLNETVEIDCNLLYFSSYFAHQFLNSASFIFGTIIWEPINFEFIDLSGNAIFETCIITRIFHLYYISIEDIVPQEVFIGMFLEGSS